MSSRPRTCRFSQTIHSTFATQARSRRQAISSASPLILLFRSQAGSSRAPSLGLCLPGRSLFSTTSPSASSPKPPAYPAPTARQPSRSAISPLTEHVPDPTPAPQLDATPDLKVQPTPQRPIRPLSAEELIPPHPYSASHHDSLRDRKLKNSLSLDERIELESLDRMIADWSLAVEEAEVCRSFDMVPVDTTTPTGAVFLSTLQKMGGQLSLKDVWGGFLLPDTRTMGQNQQGTKAAFSLVVSSNSTEWRIWTYATIAVLGTMFPYAVAAQLTELIEPATYDGSVTSFLRTPWGGWVATSGAVSVFCVLPWLTAGAHKRLNPSRWTRSNSSLVFGPRVNAVLAPFDRQVVKSDAWGRFHEELEYLPLRMSAFRMWTSNFSHYNTKLLGRNLLYLWVAGGIAYGCFFLRDQDASSEGVVAYARHTIGSAPSDSAREPSSSSTPNVASQTGVFHFAVFVMTAGVFGAFCHQVRFSYDLLPKAAKVLRRQLFDQKSLVQMNPPWFLYQPQKGAPKIVMGERLINVLGLKPVGGGLSDSVFALSTLALLASPDRWIMGTVPAVIPAVLFSVPLLAKDLSSIRRDWGTPRQHWGHLPAILFGAVYFFFGYSFFDYFVSKTGSGPIVIPDPNAEPTPMPEPVPVEEEPYLETYTFQGKVYRLPPRDTGVAPPS